MFYSQFILAKKGPLGTIWIAAHLERKLRKNQVADTDIGVSVDSILFPDVPIALRLSSHLLVGVVRIYSRKVNYLFDDCSEALLKIKQAFRSTAVDLPPEESTAPYHSITLPETFDLDDFELPDNEMFQGNYVDHHISTKEQITLQDTMDGVVYSTSQFGLDERFGEGDASQIGLDIDGDLFMDKVTTEENDGILGLSPLESAQPMTPGEKDGIYEGIPGTLEMMQENGGNDQTDNPAESREAPEHLLPPFTPGFECFTPFNDLETDQVGAKDHKLQESEAADYGANRNINSDAQEMVSQPEEIGNFPSDMEKLKQSDSIEHSAAVAVGTENMSADQGVPAPSSAMAEQLRNIPQLQECSNGDIGVEDGPIRVDEGHNGDVINNEQSTHLVDRTDMQFAESPSVSQVTTELEDPGRRTCSIDGEIHNNMEESCSTCNVLTSNVCPQESPDQPEVVNAEAQTFLEPKETEILTNSTHELNNEFSGLRACNSFRHPDLPLPGGEGILTNSTHELNKEFHGLSACTSFRQPDMSSPGGEGLESGPMLHTETPDESRNLNDETDNASSRANQLTSAGTSGSAASDLPAPEKLLAVPEGLKPNDLLLISTPEKECHGNSMDEVNTELFSGKKRSFTESTMTVHSLKSADSFSMNKSRRTADSVPGDDDLLSSILVGRKSSVLKLKPTPPASEILSRKRHRSTPRPSALKRKVLLDDMMVLHGVTIRQQLTNTEDIRRLRKKAPCTRPEIAMIQRQFMEEEIFREPIFTGMAEELVSLHREAFDLISVKVYEVETEITPIELGKDAESSVMRHDEETQHGDLCIEDQNLHVENSEMRSQEETPAEVAEMEIDGQDLQYFDTLGHSVSDLGQMLPSNPVADDCAHIPENILETGVVDGSIDIDASIQMDRPCMSLQVFDTVAVEDSLVADTNKMEVDTTELNENNAEVRVDFEKDESNFNVSLETASENMTIINENQSTDIIEDIDHTIVNSDVDPIDLGCDEKVVTPSALGEGANKDPGFSMEPDVNGEIDPIDKDENIEFQDQADLGSMNADIVAETLATEFRGDFEDVMAGHNAMAVHDTEFLNVDDDEVDEDNEDYTEGAEETRVQENSGWSSRTRAVSKYLQILFEKEPVQGKRVLAMDNLLIGKTRKEASRMFFETLVLKTKDYVHVEQANPFDNINVKPRIKLMKSDF